jgi:hypothetical protein
MNPTVSPSSKKGKDKGAPEMSISNEKGLRSGRGMSMEMGMGHPYLLPPELHNSRESLHSLSRSIHGTDDRYARGTTFIPGDGSSVRSYTASPRRFPDNSSIDTGSSGGGHSAKDNMKQELLKNAGAMSHSNLPKRQASLPANDGPNTEVPESSTPQVPRKNLPPAAAGGALQPPTMAQDRDSYIDRDGGDMRRSNNYLAGFINYRASSLGADKELHMDPPVPQQPEKRKTPPPTINKRSSTPKSIRVDSAVAPTSKATRDDTQLDSDSDYGDAFNVTPPSPDRKPEPPATNTRKPNTITAPVSELTTPTNNYHTTANEYDTIAKEYHKPTGDYHIPSNEHNTPANEYHAATNEHHTPTNEYDAIANELRQPPSEHQKKADKRGVPVIEYDTPASAHGTSVNGYGTPASEHGILVNEHGASGLEAPSFDSHRLSLSIRPLPREDPSDSPEQRANRIRSFYKEYFDDSKPVPALSNTTGGYYEDYDPEFLEYHQGDAAAVFDAETGDFVVAKAPYAEPVTRRAMTPPPRAPPRFQGRGPSHRGQQSMSGFMPPGPRAHSSASSRLGPGGRRMRPSKPLPPPSPLRVLPTPHLLKEDAFVLPIEFAPPPTYKDRAVGRPESPLGGYRPYSPSVRAHTPLVSPFEELAVMPSP